MRPAVPQMCISKSKRAAWNSRMSSAASGKLAGWAPPVPGCHYPGLTIVDVPGDFLGEAISDKENFIVQPFIDLLATEAFDGAQLIITGASFEGLQGGISATDSGSRRMIE